MKLTPWFDGKIKPVRVGPYQQRDDYGRIGYQYWDGTLWHGWVGFAKDAKPNCPVPPHYQNDNWRGILK